MSSKITPKIEIEFRSIFNETKYKEIQEFLNKNAKDLGKDNQNVWFFLLSDKIVKVTNNLSKKITKIVIKLNRLGKGSSDFEEIEIPINPLDFDKAVKLFSALPFDQIQNTYQKRHNYEYKGIELSLKHTESWGYHMELEVIIEDKSKKEAAEEKIREVAKELGIKIMSEQELTDFAKKIDGQYKQGLYNKTR
jgi:predicted adenylyl cyclase CyaB